MRGCNFCGAYFEKGNDEENLRYVIEHLKVCTKEISYDSDPNTDGYVPVPDD